MSSLPLYERVQPSIREVLVRHLCAQNCIDTNTGLLSISNYIRYFTQSDRPKNEAQTV